jgi:hypothetical protein
MREGKNMGIMTTFKKPTLESPRSDGCPVCRVGRMQVQETWFAQRTAQDVLRPVLVCDSS